MFITSPDVCVVHRACISDSFSHFFFVLFCFDSFSLTVNTALVHGRPVPKPRKRVPIWFTRRNRTVNNVEMSLLHTLPFIRVDFANFRFTKISSRTKTENFYPKC